MDKKLVGYDNVAGKLIERKQYVFNQTAFDRDNFTKAQEIILINDGLTTYQRWEDETRVLMGLIIKEFDINENSLILDYGCGVGRISKELINKYGCYIVGADPSPKMRSYACDYVSNPNFMVMDPQALDHFNLQFDFVLSIWVLQHAVQPIDDIGRLHNNMKKGAKLFVLNTTGRAVPTIEGHWIDDDLQVKHLLQEHFEEKKLIVDVTNSNSMKYSFCGIYTKPTEEMFNYKVII